MGDSGWIKIAGQLQKIVRQITCSHGNAHFDLFQDAYGIIGENRGRAVERDQIGRDGFAIDAHEPHRKPGRLFARQARVETCR